MVRESGQSVRRVTNKNDIHKEKQKKLYLVPLLLLPLLAFPNFVKLPDCERRGDVGPRAGRVGVPPWTDLPSNRILYIPFSIFAYSSNIFIANLDLTDSMLAVGILKNSFL